MNNAKFDAMHKIPERDWLKLQLEHYSRTVSGPDHSVYFVVRWNEIDCHINSLLFDIWRRNNVPKEKREEHFLAWANKERGVLEDILGQQPALSKLFDLDKNLTIHINDDYGKGAATVCKIRGNQIVLHLYEGDFS